jgi:thiol-disulfide isomerase/thioredoxin
MIGSIMSVNPGSPAAKAGLVVGDQLLAFDGHDFSQTRDFIQHIRTTPIGTAIHLSVDRTGVTKRISVVVAAVPAVMPQPPAAPAPPPKTFGPPPKTAAPLFDVDVLAGSPDAHARLADLAGHVVVLDFWATWCNPCKMAMPGLVALQAAHAAAGLRVIGVSSEDTDDIRDFLSTHPLGYTVARDATGAAWAAYGVSPIPMLVVIDKAGQVEQVFLGAGHDAEIEALVTRLLQP